MKLLPPCRWHILKLYGTKFDFSLGFAPDLHVELKALPQAPELYFSGLLIGPNGEEGARTGEDIGNTEKGEGKGK